MKDTVFFRQAELLLRILPLVHREEVFALSRYHLKNGKMITQSILLAP